MTIKPLNGEAGEVQFEISSKKKWAAIGFNSEKKMVRSYVVRLDFSKHPNKELSLLQTNEALPRPRKESPTGVAPMFFRTSVGCCT